VNKIENRIDEPEDRTIEFIRCEPQVEKKRKQYHLEDSDDNKGVNICVIRDSEGEKRDTEKAFEKIMSETLQIWKKT
jgi:hypothetical protein